MMISDIKPNISVLKKTLDRCYKILLDATEEQDIHAAELDQALHELMEETNHQETYHSIKLEKTRQAEQNDAHRLSEALEMLNEINEILEKVA